MGTQRLSDVCVCVQPCAAVSLYFFPASEVPVGSGRDGAGLRVSIDTTSSGITVFMVSGLPARLILWAAPLHTNCVIDWQRSPAALTSTHWYCSGEREEDVHRFTLTLRHSASPAQLPLISHRIKWLYCSLPSQSVKVLYLFYFIYFKYKNHPPSPKQSDVSVDAQSYSYIPTGCTGEKILCQTRGKRNKQIMLTWYEI